MHGAHCRMPLLSELASALALFSVLARFFSGGEGCLEAVKARFQLVLFDGMTCSANEKHYIMIVSSQSLA